MLFLFVTLSVWLWMSCRVAQGVLAQVHPVSFEVIREVKVATPAGVPFLVYKREQVRGPFRWSILCSWRSTSLQAHTLKIVPRYPARSTFGAVVVVTGPRVAGAAMPLRTLLSSHPVAPYTCLKRTRWRWWTPGTATRWSRSRSRPVTCRPMARSWRRCLPKPALALQTFISSPGTSPAACS